MYNSPLFTSKATFARIVFFGPANDWRAKTALIALKFTLNILHNCEIRQQFSPLTCCCEK